MTTDLVKFSSENGDAVTDVLSSEEKKQLGHFLTPPLIARFMAQRATANISKDFLRILEPAAGSGILIASVIESLIAKPNKPKKIRAVLFEIDSRLLPALKKLLKKIRLMAKTHGVDFSASIRNEDFLLSEEARRQQPVADLIISNPPYFKIGAADKRAVYHQYAVYGQPNIYGLFMAACSGILFPNGNWCFITPRSWTNGDYFSAVRRVLIKNIKFEAIHIFDSRKDHFEAKILQEAMITWGKVRIVAPDQILISSSNGIQDLEKSKLSSQPFYKVVNSNYDRNISINLNEKSEIQKFSSVLSSYGLKVSTGPVVAFRAKHLIHESSSKKTVPLLWMQHVKHNKISWPIEKKKEYIIESDESNWMLVSNSPFVVIRRFSPKEDTRRVTSAAYVGDLPGKSIGLENHLNYIYRPNGRVSVDEAKGLAAYLNSRIVDEFFRSIAGSTQINAGELKRLPLPQHFQIEEIGKRCWNGMSISKSDQVVEDVLRSNGVPRTVSKLG